MYAAYWIHRHRFWLKRRWQIRRRRPKVERVKYEELVIFDDDAADIYRVALPVEELYEHMNSNARFIPDTRMPQYAGAGAAYLVGIPVMGLPWFLLGVDIIVVALLAVCLAMVFAVPGWIVGPMFGPKPQWIGVRTGDGIKPFDLDGYFSPDDPEASFVAEMLQMRDLKMVLSAGKSKMQQIQLAATITLVVCLVVALFFFVTVFQ